MTTPEELAAELVTVGRREDGASPRVELRGRGLPTLRICPSPNPARARETAEAIQAFVAAVIRDARGQSPASA
jgi:hypothetical protein